MKKRIWIVGHYTMPPEYESRIKTLMWAKYLMKAGYEVTIISASTLHNTNINLIKDNNPFIRKKYDDYQFIHIKCDSYSGSGIKRVRNLMQFTNRFKKYAYDFGELPDVILAADIHCVDYKPVAQFAKKNKIKFIVDIRDLWPESIIEYLNYSKNNPIIKYLYNEERKMYCLADNVIFSMEGGKQYIKDKGWNKDSGGPVDLNKVHYINNGIILQDFEYNKEHYQLDDEDLKSSKFKAVYIGSIRKVNNIGMLVDVAMSLKDKKNYNVQILVYGDGNEREALEQHCLEKDLNNICFKGRVDKEYIPYILSQCDLNIMHGASMNLGRYGLSLNKSFDYLASGKPILSDIKCNYDYIINNNAGILVNCNDQDIADGIIKVSTMDRTKYVQMCKNAKETAKKYDFSVLTDRLIKIIEN